MGKAFFDTLVHNVTASGAIEQYRFVRHAGAHSGAGNAALGVAQHAAAVGESAAVQVLGIGQVEAGAAVAVGDAVESDASGKAITNTTGVILGRALEAAAADGDFITIVIGQQ